MTVRITLRAAVLSDVIGVPTLGGVGVSTGNVGRLRRISMSCWTIHVCCILFFVGSDTVVLGSFNNSAAANTVLSSFDVVGVLQCVGKSLVWAEILVALVESTKWRP